MFVVADTPALYHGFEVPQGLSEMHGREDNMGSISDHAKKGDVPAKRTYRVSEIADILGVSNATAYRLIKEGHFRTVRIGSSIRVSKQSFDEWLDRETN